MFLITIQAQAYMYMYMLCVQVYVVPNLSFPSITCSFGKVNVHVHVFGTLICKDILAYIYMYMHTIPLASGFGHVSDPVYPGSAKRHW